MSQQNKRQRVLSQDELELHAILGSPSASFSTATAFSSNENDQHNIIENPPQNENKVKENSKNPDMRQMFKEFMEYYNEMKDYKEPEQEEEEDEELPIAQPMFGVNVNEQSIRVEAGEGTYAPSEILPNTSAFISDAPVDVNMPHTTAAAPTQTYNMIPSNVPIPTGNAPIISGHVPLTSGNAPGSSSTTSLPLPDASLPLPSLRPPKNWDPDPSVLSWAVTTLDTCEWSKEDKDSVIKEFSPNEAYDHIFTAVPNPPDLLAAIKHKENLDRDYLFKRAETEHHLFSAAEDLSCGLRPLVDVISELKGQNLDHIRTKLAKVFQSMASASCKISRGRRELGRRFVPLETAPSLFRSKPSHSSIFGGKSVDEAVQKAADSKKVNKDLVFVSRKRTQPFRGSGSSSKWRGRGFAQQQQYNPSFAGGYRGFPRFWRGRGRWAWGKGRRGTRGTRGRSKKPKASNQE